MRTFFSVAATALVMLAAACGAAPGAKPTALPTAKPTAARVTQPQPVASPASPAGTPTPSAAVSPVEFFLEILAPEDESVVRASKVTVSGRTALDAVVAVNGQVAQVDSDGSFSTTLSLEEGPNSIEVLASDFQDQHASRILSVIYVP